MSRCCGITIAFSNEIIGSVMKCPFNNSLPADKVKKGPFGMIQNERVPSFFINILIESNGDHNVKLLTVEL